MAVTVIDSKGELEAYIAQTTPETLPAENPAEPAKEAPGEPAEPKTDQIEDPDDIEDEQGLTPRLRRELSAKMLKAIGKKHREMKEAEEFAAAQYSEKRLAEARAAALEEENRRLKGAQPVPRETEAEPDPNAGKPKRESFQSDEAYWEAVIDWRADKKADQKFKERDEKQAKEAAERRVAEIMSNAEARVARARELVPDFATVGAAADGMISPYVRDYLLKSEMIAELTYHLAKNPRLVDQLAKLEPDEQLVTIGKIEGTLKPFEPNGSKTTNGATPSKAVTNGNASHEEEPSETGSIPSRARGSAPVITPLTSSSALQVEKAPADMTTRELISDWQNKHKVRLVGLRKRH